MYPTLPEWAPQVPSICVGNMALTRVEAQAIYRADVQVYMIGNRVDTGDNQPQRLTDLELLVDLLEDRYVVEDATPITVSIGQDIHSAYNVTVTTEFVFGRREN